MKTKWREIIAIVVALLLISLVINSFAGWDNTKPSDADAFYTWPASIRDNWDALETAFGADLNGIIVAVSWADVSAYGAVGDGVTDDRDAIQAAIDSLTSGGTVFINVNCAVKSDITLLDNITIMMGPKGKLTIPIDAVITNAVLYSDGKSNIVFDSLTIDASATNGVYGIYPYNADNCVIVNCKLTECRINLHSSDNSVDRNIVCRDNYLDMASYAVAGIYVSAVKNVSIENNTVKDATEGIGVYNFANNITIDGNTCYDMTQDGIVNIQGFDILITNNHCYSNEQSGITLQRMFTFEDSRRIVVSGNICHNNTVEGIDLNGGSYSNPFEVIASDNILYSNTGCGIYVTNGHSLMLLNNFIYSNAKQGIFLNGTNRGMLSGNVCSSNASAISNGLNKAGILLYNTAYITVIGCVSSNAHGAVQDYGLSETGTTAYSTIIGGYYQNNVESALMSINVYSTLLGVQNIPRTIRVLASADATPSVLSYSPSETFLTGGTTTITDFDSGVEGQIITIIGQHSLTITDGTNIILDGGANMSMTSGDTLMLIQLADTYWYQLSESNNN